MIFRHPGERSIRLKTFTVENSFGDEENIHIQKLNALFSNPEPHVHEFIELIYIYSGCGQHVIDGKVYDVRSGDLLFINYGQTHAVRNSEMEFVNILLKPDFMSEKLVNSENIFEIFALSGFSVSPEEYALPLASFRGDEFASVHAIVNTLLREYADKNAGYKNILYGYLQVLFTMMIRTLKQHDSGVCGSFVADITAYIDAHLHEKITLSAIASECFYNPSYFSRKFREYYGKTLTAYIREKRLSEAAKLLLSSDKSVAEISDSVGFSDTALLHKAFRLQFACTPDEYRKSKNTTHTRKDIP